MKKYLLSLIAIVICASLSFSQQEENTSQKVEIKKIEVKAAKAVKAENIKKAEKISPANIKAVEMNATQREKAVKTEEKIED